MSVALANVSFGILAFLPLGWLIMALIIVAEVIVASRVIKKSWWDKRVAIAVSVANFFSGLIGIVASISLNGGWWLVVWFPWVSNKEVYFPRHLQLFCVYYAVAFVLSVLIEAIIEWGILKKDFSRRLIFKGCLLANLFTYLLGSVAFYYWSFNRVVYSY